MTHSVSMNDLHAVFGIYNLGALAGRRFGAGYNYTTTSTTTVSGGQGSQTTTTTTTTTVNAVDRGTYRSSNIHLGTLYGIYPWVPGTTQRIVGGAPQGPNGDGTIYCGSQTVSSNVATSNSSGYVTGGGY